MQHSNSLKFHAHKSPGFSFIEIVLTVALIGAVFTPVFMIQYNVLGLLTRSSDKVRRIFLTDMSYNQATPQEKPDEDIKALGVEKKYDDPLVLVRYQVKDIPEKSPLKKLKGLYAAQARATWPATTGEQDQAELSFIFRVPSEEEKPAAKKATPGKPGGPITGEGDEGSPSPELDEEKKAESPSKPGTPSPAQPTPSPRPSPTPGRTR